MSEPPRSGHEKRLRPVTWAAIGCSVLTLLALAALAACGWFVLRVIEGLGGSG